MANTGTTANPAVGDEYYHMVNNRPAIATVVEIRDAQKLRASGATETERTYLLLDDEDKANYFANSYFDEDVHIPLEELQGEYFDTKDDLLASL